MDETTTPDVQPETAVAAPEADTAHEEPTVEDVVAEAPTPEVEVTPAVTEAPVEEAPAEAVDPISVGLNVNEGQTVNREAVVNQ
jgi:hypothetical protein